MQVALHNANSYMQYMAQVNQVNRNSPQFSLFSLGMEFVNYQ